MAASAIDRKFNSPTLRKTSRGPPSFTPPATIREMGGEREDDLYSGAAENQNGNMKLKRWLSVSVDDLQQLVRTALIAAELGETKKNISLSTGDNEEGGFVDIDIETRIHLNKLSLIPVVVKHSFSIDPADLVKPRSLSCCPGNGKYLPQQHSFEDPITGEKMTAEEYQTLAMDDNVRLNQFDPEWCLDKTQ